MDSSLGSTRDQQWLTLKLTPLMITTKSPLTSDLEDEPKRIEMRSIRSVGTAAFADLFERHSMPRAEAVESPIELHLILRPLRGKTTTAKSRYTPMRTMTIHSVGDTIACREAIKTCRTSTVQARASRLRWRGCGISFLKARTKCASRQKWAASVNVIVSVMRGYRSMQMVCVQRMGLRRTWLEVMRGRRASNP